MSAHRLAVALGAAGALLLVGCEQGLLDVDTSGIIVPADLDEAGPAAIETLVNGAVGSYHEAASGVALYSGMLTDEMILAGTFPTRFQVDGRRILPNNSSLENELYVPLHRARFQADTTAFLLQQRLTDPDFEDAELLLRQGIAIARLYSGFSRLWLAELYCWSILTGMFPESVPRMPDERTLDALEFLEEAEAAAAASGVIPVQIAAIIGQARAHMWLGNYPQALALVQVIPRGFNYRAEYSGNSTAQYNPVYAFTWGDTQAIRWTVGDGTAGSTAGERWAHLEEFIGLNLLVNRPPGLSAQSGAVPVVLQTLYSERDADILMASWTEAWLIAAEAAVRSAQTGFAQALINDLRSDYSVRAAVEWGVDPPAEGNLLPPIALTGDPAVDLERIVSERARELWLTGDRHTTARRLRRDAQVDIDLFPSKALIGGGDDIAFPIVQREIDNNPNLGSGGACPAGQSPGSWR